MHPGRSPSGGCDVAPLVMSEEVDGETGWNVRSTNSAHADYDREVDDDGNVVGAEVGVVN